MIDSRDLVSWFVDECRDNDAEEMVPMKGQVARRVKDMLACGANPGDVKETISVFVQRRGRTPLQLPELYAKVVRSKRSGEALSGRQRASQWVREHGWPTGARFVRGTHSGCCVYDPLGTDRPPADWPYPKPSFDDIVQAVQQAVQADERRNHASNPETR